NLFKSTITGSHSLKAYIICSGNSQSEADMTQQLSEEQAKKLMEAAIAAASNAHAPYSKYKVGAALLLSNGTDIVPGCNGENCAYPNTNCAEKTAVCSAVARGHRSFTALAARGVPAPLRLLPAAHVRVLREDFPIYLVRSDDGQFVKRLLGECLPEAFRPECLL
uniref:CMP/dCMP-type deaminase domain-containing protein n=1 Tax=Macrostomum lignano TaxID=282301 RepID=A0A1I8HTP3_9PLAT